MISPVSFTNAGKTSSGRTRPKRPKVAFQVGDEVTEAARIGTVTETDGKRCQKSAFRLTYSYISTGCLPVFMLKRIIPSGKDTCECVSVSVSVCESDRDKYWMEAVFRSYGDKYAVL